GVRGDGPRRAGHAAPTRRSSDLDMVRPLGGTITAYKVGLTLLARPGGVAFAHELRAQGKFIFQDWKLHDIGAQVEGAARALHLRSEEHTSALQSRENLACRLQLE